MVKRLTDEAINELMREMRKDIKRRKEAWEATGNSQGQAWISYEYALRIINYLRRNR